MSSHSSQVAAGASDATGRVVQDLEFTLGEGPGFDAHLEGESVFVDEARSDGIWPQFTPEVLSLGIRALYALPLHVGAIKLGVLVLYRSAPGPLDTETGADVRLIADLVTDLVLAVQSDASAEALAWAFDAFDYRAVVHQATGMISVQLACALDEALVRLRAFAFAAERPIDEVADDVVLGRLRLDRT
jgi:GAF domain-containing protein